MQARGGVIGSRAIAAPRYRRAPAVVVRRTAPRRRWSFRLLLLFLLLLYASLPLHFPQLEKIAPAQSVAVAALVMLFFEKALSRRMVRLVSPETYLMFGFVVAAGFSVFGALWSFYAAEQTLLLIKMVAVYLLVVDTVDTWERLRIAMGIAVVGGLFPAIGTLVEYPRDGWAEGTRAGWVGIFANPNDLAYSLVMLLPLALAMASTSRRLYAKPLFWVAALAYTAAALITFSRGGLLGLLVVSLLCLLLWGSASARIVGALVLAAIVVFATSFWTRDDTDGVVDEATLSLRLQTVKAGISMLADNPLFGVGLGCSVLGWPLYAPPSTDAEHWLHSHNTVVQVFAETGVVGGTAFVLLVGTTIYGASMQARRWRRRNRSDLHRLVSAPVISLVGFLVCGLTGGYLLSWFPYLMLGLATAARTLPDPVPAAAVLPAPAPVSRVLARAEAHPISRRAARPRQSARAAR